jgi:hypothetical protein
MAGDRALKGTGVAIPQLLDWLRKIQARKLLFIINACLSGHVGATLAPAVGPAVPPSDVHAVEILGTGEGRVVLTASRPGQFSFYKKEQPHSHFGQALIEGLRGQGVPNAGGYVGLYELYLHIYQSVNAKVGDD